MRFLVFDVEADNLLKDATKIHCLSIWTEEGGIRTTTDYETMRRTLLTAGHYFVGHNIQGYDLPLLEKLLGIELDYTKFLDTLSVSFSVFPKRPKHGLESYGEELGIPKISVEDSQWEEGDPELMKLRCERDVDINVRVFKGQLELLDFLYEDRTKVLEFIRFVSFKSEQLHQQECNYLVPINLDTVKKNRAMMEKIKEAKVKVLEQVMPNSKIKRIRKPPANPYKQDGTLSVQGQKWLQLTQESGLPFDHREDIILEEDSGSCKPTSEKQQKAWLFSLGWEPCTFKQGANGDVPQVFHKVGQENVLTPSVEKLLSIEPKIKELEAMGQLTHRIGLLKGFEECYDNGYINSLASGFTKTLRLKHKKPIANLPKVGKPNKETGERLFSDGYYIRGCIEAPEGYLVVGSDMSSLEDRMKQHFIYDLDPDYVHDMMVEDFDPHLDLSLAAGVLTQEQVDAHKRGDEDHSEVRHTYKTANYTLQFGAGAPKLAITVNKKLKEAKAIKDAYWKRNWAVKEAPKSAKKKQWKGHTYLLNPVNDYWYFLSAEKDIFSSWCQAGGAFLVDAWIKLMRAGGYTPSLSYHDEVLILIKDTEEERQKVEKVLRGSIQKINKIFKLKRELDVDVQFGRTYASVH